MLPVPPKLEVSNLGNFVILEMDGSDKLVVGMRPAQPEEVMSGELRLALGGVLINSHHMMVPVGLLSAPEAAVSAGFRIIVGAAVLWSRLCERPWSFH